MATLGDALLTTLSDSWGAGGGAEPTFHNTEDIKLLPTIIDATGHVIFIGYTQKSKFARKTADHVRKEHRVRLAVYTADGTDKEERLDEVLNELERIMGVSTPTGYDGVEVEDVDRSLSDKSRDIYAAYMDVMLVEVLADSAITPGAVATSELEVDELTVNISAAITGLTATGDTTIASAPTATGTQNIFKITPANVLDAGSVWVGVDESLTALDPATGAVSYIIGYRVNAEGITSVDGDAVIYAFSAIGTQDNFYGFYTSAISSGGASGVLHSFFHSVNNAIMAHTYTSRGLHIDWDGATRSANAPVLEGVKVELPADYSDFGSNKAGYFSGDGRTVTLCDTTYAADISGDYRLDGMTNAQLEDLLMFGSANAAWVPCVYFINAVPELLDQTLSGWMKPITTGTKYWCFKLPLPTVKAGLKLYISGSRVCLNDADGSDYVDETHVEGITESATAVINNDMTNYDSKAKHDDTFTAVDCSGYDSVNVELKIVIAATADFILSDVLLRCYYAA